MGGPFRPEAAPAWARAAALAVAAGLGGLFAVGAVIAALFEVQGFGREAADPRPGYLLVLAVGFAAALGVPALLARWLFPRRAGRVAVAVLFASVVGAVALLGLSLTA